MESCRVSTNTHIGIFGKPWAVSYAAHAMMPGRAKVMVMKMIQLQIAVGKIGDVYSVFIVVPQMKII